MAAGHTFLSCYILALFLGHLNVFSVRTTLPRRPSTQLPFDESVGVSIPAFSYRKAPFVIAVRSGAKHGRGDRYLYVKIPHSAKSLSSFQVSRLALCGDVHSNPGTTRKIMPPKFPSKECGKAVRNNQFAILSVRN